MTSLQGIDLVQAMGLQGFEGCDRPFEPSWQLHTTYADCAEEDGGPICQSTGVWSIGQVV